MPDPEDTTTGAAPDASPEPVAVAEPPRTLNITVCEVCSRNKVDGKCAHCGFGMTGTRD